jgi:heme/copper-type cytochrome/quinol oxidase subunit 2
MYYPASAAPPSNNAAVASIIIACSSIGTLLFTAGVLAPFTLIASGVATYLGHKGKNDVDQGKTPVQRDLAVGGFWTGIGGIVLSVLAIIAWIVIIALIIAADESGSFTYDENFHDFNFD